MRVLKFFLLLLLLASCKNGNKTVEENDVVEEHTYVDSLYTIDSSFKVGDVRRYGVEPGKGIGQHPTLLKDKLDVLLDISETGVEIFFPKGIYDRTFNIENRKNIKINSDSATFTGAINIKNSELIKIDGVIQSLSRFYTQNAKSISVDEIITETNVEDKMNNLRSTGVSIHGGSEDITIKKVLIKDSGSGPQQYKYIKAGFIVHGHNNEPREIKIDTVIVESSDRHGVYLTGEEIDIKYLNVKKFGVGSGENMAKMEGGIEGEQLKFSGLWIKNCHNSFIDKAIIDLSDSKGTYSVNFDIGEEFRPTVIETLILKGTNINTTLKQRTFSRTGVRVENIIEK